MKPLLIFFAVIVIWVYLTRQMDQMTLHNAEIIASRYGVSAEQFEIACGTQDENGNDIISYPTTQAGIQELCEEIKAGDNESSHKAPP